MNWKLQQIWVFFLAAVVLSGCVNLRHVSDFSQTALAGIEKYEELPHSYTRHCLEDCRLNNIRRLDIHRTDCSCTLDQKADSVTRVLYLAVRDYFNALGNISNNELTQYRTEDLTGVLSSGDFGPITLKPEDVDAYSKISTVLLRAFTDGYRRKEIRKYIVQSDESVQILLKYLDLNLSGNLRGKLEAQKAMVKNFYFDLVNDKNLSVYERTKFTEDYFAKIAAIENKQAALDAYSAVIKGIASGHASLKENIANLSDREIANLLSNYGSQLQDAISAFNRNTE